MPLTVFAIKSPRKDNKFDLFEEIIDSMSQSGISLKNGDVLVISSKYVAYSQGRLLDFDSVNPSDEGYIISKKFQMEPQLAEVIIRESDVIFGGVSGFVLASNDSILSPNAGIDRSNTKKGEIDSLS